jgi:DNA mismatch repair protein MutL
MTIKVLDSRVISQIAAGEVVERPASVVKELLENALDANSTQISVEIRNSGLDLIRVTDDGVGIIDSEVELAFQRHATSKIDGIQDLQKLTTLGFRGEALPSIAAVADVHVLTNYKGSERGTLVALEDSRIIKHESHARSQGTTISVQNLFRRIPARLKFLKSPAAEASRIANVVSQYALDYPEVRFILKNDEKTTLRSIGSGKLMDSVIAVYGLEIAQNMLEVKDRSSEFETGNAYIKVSGLAGTPAVARASRDYLSFFVNRRWISSRSLSFAAEEAYHGLLMQGKHPIVIINITISPDAIDVNVHPAKTEIKFRDERAVFGAVQKAIRTCLVSTTPVPQFEDTKQAFNVPGRPFTSVHPWTTSSRPASSSSSLNTPSIQPTPIMSLPLLRVLGQLACSYIVTEGQDGLYLLDQHAAHERIMIENIKKQKAEQKIEMQGLLQPATIELSPNQAAILESHLSQLTEFGFDVQHFGDRTFVVKAVPAVMKDRDWLSMLHDTLETQTNDWSEHILNRLACHSAIRAGQVLSDSEMRELVRQLEQTTLPNSCPHGRPTMIRLTIDQLEREFGRT